MPRFDEIDPFFDWVGFGVMCFGILMIIGFVLSSSLPSKVKKIICLGLLLRIVGAFIRYEVTFGLYGRGDAALYFDWGMYYTWFIHRWDFSFIFDPEYWRGSRWWGTNFVGFPSGFTLALIGPSPRGQFLFFSLFSFVGLVGFAIAFARAFPWADKLSYYFWIFVFPALWFWPSSTGKESLVLMGLGLFVWGYVGKNNRVSWFILLLGLALTFAVRPQIVAVIGLALILGYWLGTPNILSPPKLAQGLAIFLIGMGVMYYSLGTLGMGLDAEDVTEYIEYYQGRNITATGGITDQRGVGLAGVPLSVINTLFRPFAWEVRNITQLVSAMEILLLWGLVYWKRRNLKNAIKYWRGNKLLRFALPFFVIYVILIGMATSNMGLLARQRIFIFPFIFMFVFAYPYISKRAMMRMRYMRMMMHRKRMQALQQRRGSAPIA